MRPIIHLLPKELTNRLDRPKTPIIVEYSALLLKEARKLKEDRLFLTYLAIRSLTKASYKINKPSFFKLTRHQLITLLSTYVDFTGKFACTRRELDESIIKMISAGLLEVDRHGYHHLLAWKYIYKRYRSCQEDTFNTKVYLEKVPTFIVKIVAKKYSLRACELTFQLEDMRYFFKRQAIRALASDIKINDSQDKRPDAAKRKYRRIKHKARYEARLALAAIQPGKAMNISQQRLADEVFGLSRSLTRLRLIEMADLKLLTMTDCGSVLVEHDELIASRYKFLMLQHEDPDNDPFGIFELSDLEKKEMLVKASRPYHTFTREGKLYRRVANLITHGLSSMEVVKALAVSLFLTLAT